jgi:hypothetical protein
MEKRIEEAYTEYQFGKMVDPVTRYTHDDRDVFLAGWTASQKKETNFVKESVWVHVPVAPEDDTE